MQKLLKRYVPWLLSSNGVSRDWTQRKFAQSFIEFSGRRNVLVGSESAKLYA